MQLTFYVGSTCILKPKIVAAAQIAGVQLKFEDPAALPTEKVVLVRKPALLTPSGYVPGSSASLRYIANAHPAAELYGRTLGERASVDALVDAITAELETPLVALKKHNAPKEAVAGDIVAVLKKLEATLAKQTYLVGERLSIADLAVVGAMTAILTLDALPISELSAFLNLCRLYNTVAERTGALTPAAIEAKVEEEKTQQPAKKEKQAQQPKEKKADKPKAEPKPAPPKAKDPIELLPPADFDMEAWKRYYSNSKDLKGDAMPYLWEKLDKEGWSFYHMEYIRYTPEDNTKAFMASNLLGMFLQRIDNWLRKYMFGVCDVLQEDGYFGVEGIWLWRGEDVPQRLVENDQYESFKWVKLDMQADKQRIADYFCEDDSLNGKTIVDCKVFK
eukprot:Protomagalhaensia_sp_Gyna_25__493@NODE_1233_length_2039_cov_829_280000_g984_i0_p1_GENE_NODE_1233_length_2039_cov_829_280000_g984_i0NODE_1233_length_2039_cov_829_280000_g984_i0_p1_ORF_typecomplete_len391_score94_64EF1G/PF00647_19/3_6e33GST_C/PF00043_25/1e10GST_C/PF00043_25/1_8e04GST_C_3/PF14497_6/6_8e09GST_C_3/PF14497_6/7_9e03GST_C_2/PF13410_6/1_8e06GST_C_2/PF13410_6/4_2e03GST_C_6/PF17171_4/2_6e03GST_C_6/PF17171_4/0_0023GST_C_6/PF17171_4/8_6e03GST_C_5/PF16865_5/0_061FAP/PF07174_11/0_18DUF4678/PF1